MPDGTSFERFDGQDPIRVMLLLPSLHGGGAERVAVNLANRCDPRLFDVKIGLLRRAGPYLADVDPWRVFTPDDGDWLRDEGRNADQYRLSAILSSALKAPRGVAEMVRAHRPEVVVSFLKGMSIATKFGLQDLGQDRPVWIAREGNNTDVVIDDELPNPVGRWVMKRLIRHVYRSADCFLANSNDMAATLTPALGLDPERVRVIHNPIDISRVTALSGADLPEAPQRPFIVTAGRLAFQKGHDVLLKAFAASRAARGLDLVVIGQGALEAELKALAARLGIAHRVHFQGFVANPWAWFARARLFVLASRWEGCPNAVGEALACGTPTLVTDCRFGPRELVEHGHSGWIVEKDSVEALEAGLDTLLSDPALAARLGARARTRAQQFNIDRMVGEYSRLFIEQAGREPAFAPMAMAAE
jgi:glycosyltransferase involved in cell wall biosynthesis